MTEFDTCAGGASPLYRRAHARAYLGELGPWGRGEGWPHERLEIVKFEENLTYLWKGARAYPPPLPLLRTGKIVKFKKKLKLKVGLEEGVDKYQLS